MNISALNFDTLMIILFLILGANTVFEGWKDRKTSTNLERMINASNAISIIIAAIAVLFYGALSVIITFLAFHTVTGVLFTIFTWKTTPKKDRATSILGTLSTGLLLALLLSRANIGGTLFYLIIIGGIAMVVVATSLFVHGLYTRNNDELLNSLWLILLGGLMLASPFVGVFWQLLF